MNRVPHMVTEVTTPRRSRAPDSSRSRMRIDILTLFPEMFGPVLGTSIPKRAAEKGLVEYHLTNIRDFATDAHKSVDDKPFGGGPGLVMMAPVVFDAGEHVEKLDARQATR